MRASESGEAYCTLLYGLRSEIIAQKMLLCTLKGPVVLKGGKMDASKGYVQDECASDLAHFLTVCCQRSVGGLHVCVCMRGGDEEGECKARLGRLSGGIKASLQW